MQMKNKLKAILVGGPNDGQTWEFDDANSEIEIAHRSLERNGEWTVRGVVKYKLKSNGSPLQYEFVGLN
jgi:hypothetical protein